MPRIIDAFAQYFDDNGDPLIDGWLKFNESGTNNTDKDTFADINESIANTNPVQLDGAGRCPNIFGSGAYNVISFTDNSGYPGQQIQQFDPVGGNQEGGALEDWDALTIYSDGGLVTGSNGSMYRSLEDGNQGNDPITSPTKWEEVVFSSVWNSAVTYSIGDPVLGSDNLIYKSRLNSNLNNDPVTNPDKWGNGSAINSIDLVGTDAYTANYGLTAYNTDHYYFVVVANANTVVDPTVNFDSIADIVVKDSVGADIDVGQFSGAVILQYDGTVFRMVNRVSSKTGARAYVADGEVNSGIGVIPTDDTIPQQSTEGDEYLTLGIIPVNANSELLIEAVVNLSSTINGRVSAAIFRDLTEDAIDVASENKQSGELFQLNITIKVPAIDTILTTFKIKAGTSAAGTTTLNGVTGVRFFGGVFLSSITITEILP